jgi:hypothetical protein
MCGFGEKDRRPIDPPPIIQLIINPDSYENDRALESLSYVMHAGLWSDDMKIEQNIYYTGNTITKILVGSLVSSVHLSRDLNHELGIFFVFPDLSVRIDGNYRLKFVLMDISEPISKIKACLFSDIFTVYQVKKFPGMMQSTDLSCRLSEQGVKIPVRKERLRKSQSSEQDSEEAHSSYDSGEG